MYGTLKKTISILLVLSVLITSIGITDISKSYAQEINLSDKDVIAFEGVDLSEAQFNMSKMDDKQKELYNLLLEKEYAKQKNSLDEKGISKEEFINEVKSYLYNEFSFDTKDVYNSNKKAKRLISVEALGSALNVVITATLIAIGVGSIGELVKKLGKEGAKKWVKKHLSSKVAAVLIKIGAKKYSVWIGAFVVAIVDT